MSNIRVALFGCGWAASMHAASIRKAPGAELVAVGGISLDQANGFIKDHAPGAQAFDDYVKMLDAVKPEAVYLAIPPWAHNGQIELAAARGIHVFMEKPIALVPEKAAAIAGAINRAGVVSQVGYHMRHGVAVQKLKQMIADGSAGRPTLFQASFFCNSLHSPWWIRADKSGGQVLEQVIHVYDLAFYLFGEPAVAWGQIDNLCHQNVENYTIEDTSVGTVRFANGAMASIVASNCATPMRWDTKFTVVCEKVTAVFTDPNNAEFIYPVGDSSSRSESVKGDRNLYAAESADFIAAIQRKGRALAPTNDGLRSLQIVQAVLDSAADGGRPSILSAPRA